MRARVLHLGVTGVASALMIVVGLPTAAMAAQTDLSVEIAVDNPAPFLGDSATFTVVVRNIGTGDPGPDVVLDNLLPATFGFVSLVAGTGVTCGAAPAVGSTGTVTCDMEPIDAGASRQVQIQAVAQSTEPASNTATITAVSPADDTNDANNQASIAVKSPGSEPATPTPAPEWHKNEDPGYPYGWFHGDGFGDYDGYCDSDCF